MKNIHSILDKTIGALSKLLTIALLLLLLRVIESFRKTLE